MNLNDLMRCGLADLESIFAEERPVAVPSGRYHGTYLRQLDHPGAQRLSVRALDLVGFRLTPFRVDFDRCCWMFFHPWLAAGRFRAVAQPSRWRGTEVVALHYEVSRLPRLIKGVLYDEVKPLDPDLLLGLGGLQGGPGEDDHFFFALTREI